MWMYLTGMALFGGVAEAGGTMLPEATSAVGLPGPTARVEVADDGTVTFAGQSWPTVPVEPLLSSLRAWHDATPEGLLLVAADRRVDTRVVMDLVARAGEAHFPGVGLVAAGGGEAGHRMEWDPSPAYDVFERKDGRPTLRVHLTAHALELGRGGADTVRIPHPAGAIDTRALDRLLQEDRRLHPDARTLWVSVDDDVPYGEAFAVLDHAYGEGFVYGMMQRGDAAGPAAAEQAASVGPEPPVGTPVGVAVHPNGDVTVRTTGGVEEEVRHGDIQRFEAACARGQCDLVLHGSAVAWRLGTTAAAELELGWLFGRPVVVTSGRLSPAEIAVEGRLSPLVQDARKEAESPTGLSPFLFVGTVAKDKIGQLILTNLPVVQACYSALLSESPDAAGRVTMKWVIGADGRVSWVGPDNPEIRDPRFLACLSSVIRSLRFPEPEGGQVGFVRYPFAFTPG